MQFNVPINLLVIEDENYDINRIRKTLEPFSDSVIIKEAVADGQSAINILEKDSDSFDVIIMDFQIVGSLSGEQLIKRIKAINPLIQIIVITKMTINVTDFNFANRLIEAGAMWFCTKYPSDIKDYIYQPTDLLLSILNAYEKKKLLLEKSSSNLKLKKNIDSILESKIIIGESEAAKKLNRQIEKAAMQDATILISGASGTGKELVASHVHYKSKRKFESFTPVNSGSIPADLIESELFGFTKGSFTGATTSKKGLFELADKGSLFLDEIGELPMSAQVKLLRVLQEGELDKIGRTEKVNVDVRIIAATNIDLEKAVEEKNFRTDLYYRLNVINIRVPSLKERVDDIPLLANHFINLFGKQMSIDLPELHADAIDALKMYDWPGNIRQLQNVIQKLLFSCDEKITKDDVFDIINLKKINDPNHPEFWFGNEIIPWKDMENIFRKKYFQFVKSKTKNESEAARQLGIAPSNFYRMCDKIGIR